MFRGGGRAVLKIAKLKTKLVLVESPFCALWKSLRIKNRDSWEYLGEYDLYEVNQRSWLVTSDWWHFYKYLRKVDKKHWIGTWWIGLNVKVKLNDAIDSWVLLSIFASIGARNDLICVFFVKPTERWTKTKAETDRETKRDRFQGHPGPGFRPLGIQSRFRTPRVWPPTLVSPLQSLQQIIESLCVISWVFSLFYYLYFKSPQSVSLVFAFSLFACLNFDASSVHHWLHCSVLAARVFRSGIDARRTQFAIHLLLHGITHAIVRCTNQ